MGKWPVKAKMGIMLALDTIWNNHHAIRVSQNGVSWGGPPKTYFLGHPVPDNKFLSSSKCAQGKRYFSESEDIDVGFMTRPSLEGVPRWLRVFRAEPCRMAK